MSVLLTASMYRELIVAESRVYRASVGMPNALDIVVNRSLLASMAKAGVANVKTIMTVRSVDMSLFMILPPFSVWKGI